MIQLIVTNFISPKDTLHLLLRKSNKRANFLRDNFIFKIIPILNAESVINEKPIARLPEYSPNEVLIEADYREL